MATFSYTGKAQIKWKNGDVTFRFIDWEAGRDTLTVWPEEGETFEYCGPMRDHPAERITFLHLN